MDRKKTNPELEIYKGTALAGFEPVTICFRDCFKMPRELGGVVQVKNNCVGLRPAPPLAEAKVTQLATASFRDIIRLQSKLYQATDGRSQQNEWRAPA